MYSRQNPIELSGFEQTVYDFGRTDPKRELKPRFAAIYDVAEYKLAESDPCDAGKQGK